MQASAGRGGGRRRSGRWTRRRNLRTALAWGRSTDTASRRNEVTMDLQTAWSKQAATVSPMGADSAMKSSAISRTRTAGAFFLYDQIGVNSHQIRRPGIIEALCGLTDQTTGSSSDTRLRPDPPTVYDPPPVADRLPLSPAFNRFWSPEAY